MISYENESDQYFCPGSGVPRRVKEEGKRRMGQRGWIGESERRPSAVGCCRSVGEGKGNRENCNSGFSQL